jgi:transposase InsO family protein
MRKRLSRKEYVMQQEQWIADRAILQRLLQLHPEWTQQELANWIGRSVGWVKKWKKRLREAPPGDATVLLGKPSGHKTPYPQIDPLVEERVLAIRDTPPENLKRTPGPRAILYYLPRDPHLQHHKEALPRSTRTIWKILRRNDRISQQKRQKPKKPAERLQPLEEVQMDFKDVSSALPDPAGKKQHVIETFNFVDAGTSMLLDAQVQPDFHAQTALQAVVRFLQRYGLPYRITFDRDPRFVGGATGRDFPSPLMRFLLCLGIHPNVCPPHRPDKNAFVERFHRTYNQECLQVSRPQTLEQVREVTEAFMLHYNTERPNQALSCGNRPPQVAFPELPHLPALPKCVDPDAWLSHVHGQHFIRKVHHNGSVRIAEASYYIHVHMSGQYVDLCVDAQQQVFVVWHQQQILKQMPIKGLHKTMLSFEQFAALMCQQALSDQRRLLQAQQAAPAAGR